MILLWTDFIQIKLSWNWMSICCDWLVSAHLLPKGWYTKISWKQQNKKKCNYQQRRAEKMGEVVRHNWKGLLWKSSVHVFFFFDGWHLTCICAKQWWLQQWLAWVFLSPRCDFHYKITYVYIHSSIHYPVCHDCRRAYARCAIAKCTSRPKNVHPEKTNTGTDLSFF